MRICLPAVSLLRRHGQEIRILKNDLFDFYADNISAILQPMALDLVEPGENDYNGSNLKLEWQWNHNPNNNNWSLTEREGYLRLTTGDVVSDFTQARNTFTQRTYGPSMFLEILQLKQPI